MSYRPLICNQKMWFNWQRMLRRVTCRLSYMIWRSFTKTLWRRLRISILSPLIFSFNWMLTYGVKTCTERTFMWNSLALPNYRPRNRESSRLCWNRARTWQSVWCSITKSLTGRQKMARCFINLVGFIIGFISMPVFVRFRLAKIFMLKRRAWLPA